MVYFVRIGSSFFLLAAFLLVSCADAPTPAVDPNLHGSWMRLDVPAQNPPRALVSGIHIDSSHMVDALGYVLESGELAILHSGSDQVIRAGAGLLTIRRPNPIPKHGSYEISFEYRITGDVLEITHVDHDRLAGRYVRTPLGTKVIEPVAARMSVLMDGEAQTPARVGRNTSPHATFRPEDSSSGEPAELLIWGSYAPAHSMHIVVNSFDGEGSYVVGWDEVGLASYEQFVLDVSMGWNLDPEDTGVIEIESFDAEAGRLRGSYRFELHHTNIDEGSEFVGEFDLPVYPPAWPRTTSSTEAR